MPHKPKSHAERERERRGPQKDTRQSAHKRGYDSKWQRARKAFLNKHPLCVTCKRGGRVTQATVVDHIVPHKGDKALFWSRDNWQALCAPCHSTKTAREDGGFGNA